MRILRICLTLAALAAIGLTAGTASADLSFQFTTEEQIGIGPLGQFHAFPSLSVPIVNKPCSDSLLAPWSRRIVRRPR